MCRALRIFGKIFLHFEFKNLETCFLIEHPFKNLEKIRNFSIILICFKIYFYLKRTNFEVIDNAAEIEIKISAKIIPFLRPNLSAKKCNDIDPKTNPTKNNAMITLQIP